MADEVKGIIHPDPLDKLLPTGGIQKSKEDNNRDKKKKASKKTTKGTDAPGTGRTRITVDDIKFPITAKFERSTDTPKGRPKLLKPIKPTKPKSSRKSPVIDLTEEPADKPAERKLTGNKLPSDKPVKIEPPSDEDIKIDLKPTMFFKSVSTPSFDPSVLTRTFSCPSLSLFDDLCKDEGRETVNKTINLSFYF